MLVLGNDGSGAEWLSPRGAAGVIIELEPQEYWIPDIDGLLPWTVTASTNCNLKLAASGGNVIYDLILLGRY